MGKDSFIFRVDIYKGGGWGFLNLIFNNGVGEAGIIFSVWIRGSYSVEKGVWRLVFWDVSSVELLGEEGCIVINI